jgi:hypothetical protein
MAARLRIAASQMTAVRAAAAAAATISPRVQRNSRRSIGNYHTIDNCPAVAHPRMPIGMWCARNATAKPCLATLANGAKGCRCVCVDVCVYVNMCTILLRYHAKLWFHAGLHLRLRTFIFNVSPDEGISLFFSDLMVDHQQGTSLVSPLFLCLPKFMFFFLLGATISSTASLRLGL